MFDRGVDARDWIRGHRPWDQFLICCDGLAKRPGTRLRAAQLSDDRYLADIEKQIEEQKAKGKGEPYRPPLEHFDPVVEAIYALDDTVRLLSRTGVNFRLRPEQPHDRIAKRKRDYGRSRIQQILRGG
jgi:hypothetical protein